MATLGFAFTSCEKTEDRVFTESAAERTTKQQEELRNLLKSSELGWKLVYYTDINRFGGYTYLFKFKDDRAVEMLSDFSESGLTLEPGEWEVQLRGTASLVFTTRNKIHELSDPLYSPYGGGTGYYGEYQFGYYGHTESEIFMRSPKRNVDVVLVKATQEDWDSLGEHLKMEVGLTNPALPYFKNLDIEGVGRYDLGYASSIRLFNSLGDDIDGKSNLPINLTSTGIAFATPIKTGNGEVSDLTYNAETGIYSGGVEGGKVQVIPSRFAAAWTDPTYKLFLTNTPSTVDYGIFAQFPAGSPLLTSSFISPLAAKYIRDLGVNPANNASNLSQLYIQFNTTLAGIPKTNGCSFSYKGRAYQFVFNTEDMGDRLKVIPLGWTSTPPAEIVALSNIMFGEDIYIRKEKTKIQYTNLVVTLISTNGNFALPLWDNKSNI